MSVNEKMTALADEVRRLSGVEGKLGIEAMTEKLAGVEVGGGGNSQFIKSLIEGTITELTSEDLKGITTIAGYTFQNRPLTAVRIADSEVTTLNSYSFTNCLDIAVLELPKNLTSIPQSAFGYNQSNNKLEYLYIPKSVGDIGAMAMSVFKALKTVEFEENSACTVFANWAFENCVSLTHIKVPKTVWWIGSDCFRGCTSLQYADFSEYTSVPTLNNANGFANVPITCKIIVPMSLYERWKSATNWSNFADMIVPNTISGTWVFNDTITWERVTICTVNFTSNGSNYTRMSWRELADGSGNKKLFYVGTNGVYGEANQVWNNANYKTVSFGDTPQTCTAEFLAFMYHNATKQ
jgi:hypothetical protein